MRIYIHFGPTTGRAGGICRALARCTEEQLVEAAREIAYEMRRRRDPYAKTRNKTRQLSLLAQAKEETR